MYAKNLIDKKIAIANNISINSDILLGITNILLENNIGSTNTVNADNFDSITTSIIQFLTSAGYTDNISFDTDINNTIVCNYKDDDVSASYLNKSDITSILIEFPNIKKEMLFRFLTNGLLQFVPNIFYQILYCTLYGEMINNSVPMKLYNDFIISYKISEYISKSEWLNMSSVNIFKYKIDPHLSFVPYTLMCLYKNLIHLLKSEYSSGIDWILYDNDKIIFNYNSDVFTQSTFDSLSNLLNAKTFYNFNMYSGQLYLSGYKQYLWIPDADCAEYVDIISKGYTANLN